MRANPYSGIRGSPLVERTVQTACGMNKSPFVSDIQELRRRARQHIDSGAVTEGYRGDRETVIKLLNEALATELVCVLRYRRHYFMAKGPNSKSVAEEFLEHSNEEQEHADRIAARITQLDGEPDFNPSILAGRSHAEYVEGKSLAEMLKEDLVAERIAIDSYGDIVRYLGQNDPTSRRLMEEILAKEEEHAEELSNLLAQFGAEQVARVGARPEGSPTQATAHNGEPRTPKKPS
jgi:bacterioferritin